MVRRSLIIVLVALGGCTISPKIVPPPSAPRYVGNSANGGIIDLGPGNKGPAHVYQSWVDENDRLVEIYGKSNIPPVHKRDGITALPDGTYSVDLEHLSDNNVFAGEERSGIKP